MIPVSAKWLAEGIGEVEISYKTWMQMLAYALVSEKNEVNGFGMVESDELSGKRSVESVFIVDQTVSPISAQTDPESLGALVGDMARQRIDPSRMVLQWHSHVDMQAIFSAVDEQNIQTMLAQYPWILSIVINKAGQYEARLDVREPRLILPIRIVLTDYPGPTEQQLKYAQQEVKRRVKNLNRATPNNLGGVLRRRVV